MVHQSYSQPFQKERKGRIRTEVLLTSRSLRLDRVRSLDVVRLEIDDLDLLGLELSRLSRTVKGSSENASFVGINVLGDFGTKRGKKIQGEGRGFSVSQRCRKG